MSLHNARRNRSSYWVEVKRKTPLYCVEKPGAAKPEVASHVPFGT
jgi:hypothetical protein